jgi:ABC transport permease subunit
MELISPGDFAKEKVQSVQEYAGIAFRGVANLFSRPRYFGDMTQQADLIGVGSLPIVALTGFFTGAALAQNSASTLQRFGSLSLIGQLVSLGMVRELGPVITGLMVAGRNASGMASEIGSMVVTEQIDAMRALGTDPMKKLVTPRVVSTAGYRVCCSAWIRISTGVRPGRYWFFRMCSWDWQNRCCLGSLFRQLDAITGLLRAEAHRASAAPLRRRWWLRRF